MRTSLILVSLLATAGASTAASATAVAINTVFYFSGSCTDCAVAAGQPVTALAELTLTGYTIGQAIQSSNFVSFHYDGTNLIPGGFTITAPTLLTGQINNPLPGPENFSVGDFAHTFSTSTTGVWSVSGGYNPNTLDVGTGGTLSTNASAAPEPASWAMLVGGFGLVGAALRHRRRAVVRFA